MPKKNVDSIDPTVNSTVNSTVRTGDALNSTVNSTVKTDDTLNSTVNLTPLQKSILGLMADNEEITIEGISNAIGRDRNAVNYQLKKLREKGLIERKGSDKTGRWIVNINNNRN